MAADYDYYMKQQLDELHRQRARLIDRGLSQASPHPVGNPWVFGSGSSGGIANPPRPEAQEDQRKQKLLLLEI